MVKVEWVWVKIICVVLGLLIVNIIRLEIWSYSCYLLRLLMLREES